MAELRFYRPTQYTDSLRHYRLLVDDAYMGMLGAGAVLWVEVPAGRHELEARIDWCSSTRLVLDVGAADEWVVEVGASLKGWRLLLGLLYVTLWRSEYLYLRAEPYAAADRGFSGDS